MAIKKIKLPNNSIEDINDSRLPDVTSSDNGKVLSVSGGVWAKRANSDFVHTTGSETISGTKTFSDDVEIDDIISTENGTDYPNGFDWIQDYSGSSLQTALNAKLPLSGGTLTAPTGNNTALGVQSGSAGSPLISFKANDGTVNGSIGVHATNGAIFFKNSVSNTIYHSGNFIAGTNYQSPLTAGTDYVVPSTLSNYLSLSGGTMTGDLTISNNKAIKFKDIPVSEGTSAERSILSFGNGNFVQLGVGLKDVPNIHSYSGSLYINGSPLKFRTATLGASAWSVAAFINNSQNTTLGSSDLASTTTKLYVSGDIVATGSITPGSDSRVKDNQQNIKMEDALSIMEKLQPKTWIWNEKSDVNLKGKTGAGLVAQDVEKVLPFTVSIHKGEKVEDFHSLNYNAVQGYEIAAIKGLIEEVKSLKTEIAELKKQIK